MTTATAFEDARLRRATAQANLAELEIKSRLRPRINDLYRTGIGRRGAGIVLADVPDEDILNLLDQGLSRDEIAAYFGVERHIIRYRLILLEQKGHEVRDIRYFVDDLPTNPNCDVWMVPARRRRDWEKFKAAHRPGQDGPRWAWPVSDFSLLEFTKPVNAGGLHGWDD